MNTSAPMRTAQINETHCCGIGEFQDIFSQELTPLEICLTPAVSWDIVRWHEKGRIAYGQYIFMDVRSDMDMGGYDPDDEYYEEDMEFEELWTGTLGAELAAFIRKNKLGTVTEGEWAVNPNHRQEPCHENKLFIWNVDVDAYRKWAEAQPKYKEYIKWEQESRGGW